MTTPKPLPNPGDLVRINKDLVCRFGPTSISVMNVTKDWTERQLKESKKQISLHVDTGKGHVVLVPLHQVWKLWIKQQKTI